MNSATISADIISYTKLEEKDKRHIENKIKHLLLELTDKFSDFSFIGRLVHGDSIECAINTPKHALRIALLLKTYIKSLELSKQSDENKKTKYFKEHAIRLAIAVAPLETLDTKNGIIDGEAIYLSGRTIKNITTSYKQKIVIKNTMYFCSTDIKEQNAFDTILSLLDTIIARNSSKQCEVIYYKLLGLSEKELSQKLGRLQSTISQHSTAGGWLAIEKSVNYFEKNIQA